VAQVEGGGHPPQILEGEAAKRRVFEKIAVVVPVDEIVADGGEENEQYNGKDDPG
jgi:hypothetical protein